MKRSVILVSALLAASVILNLVLILAWPEDKVSEPVAKIEKPAPVKSPSLEQPSDLRNQMMIATLERQGSAELNLLRKIAIEEGAEKTTQEIERLLKTRAERLKQMMEGMKRARPRRPGEDLARERARRRREIEERMKERRLKRMRAESPNDITGAE